MPTSLPSRKRFTCRLLSLLWITLATASAADVAAHAGPPSSLDGRLRVAMHRARTQRDPRSALVRCYVQTSDTGATRARILELGGSSGVAAGDVLTVTLPISSLDALARDPDVLRLEAGTRVRPKLDRVAEIVDLTPVHDGAAPLGDSYRGRGVVVGVVDLSLDLDHPAFKGSERSRVVALWDQGGTTRPPPGFGYGRSCSREDILAGRCEPRIESEHGTHVTGIAAGSSVDESPYVGMAPLADIVFVNLSGAPGQDQSFEEWLSTSICDGVAFVFGVADDLDRPAVVNLSLGTHTGPHDGSGLECACLDQLTGPGRIIVAAAGNEGEPWLHPRSQEPVFVHASGTSGTAPQRVDFVVGEYVTEGELVDVWFDAGGAAPSLRVGVEIDGGDQSSGLVQLSDEVYETKLRTPRHLLGPIFIASDRTPEGATNFQVLVFDENGDLAELDYDWFLELQETGRFDVFLDVNGGGGLLDDRHGVVADSRMSIGYPAVGRGVIAVGSTVSRTTWRAVDGYEYEATDYLTGGSLEVGQLSTFSSRGPSRNPQRTGPKPDIVAPGEMVVSAMPTHDLEVPEATIISRYPNPYVISAGTSQAAPVVAGVVALMLERDPTLAPDDVRSLLAGTADVPLNVEVPSDAWGYGRVHALRAVAATREENAAERPPDDRGCGCQITQRLQLSAIVALWLPALLVLRRRRS